VALPHVELVEPLFDWLKRYTPPTARLSVASSREKYAVASLNLLKFCPRANGEIPQRMDDDSSFISIEIAFFRLLGLNDKFSLETSFFVAGQSAIKLVGTGRGRHKSNRATLTWFNSHMHIKMVILHIAHIVACPVRELHEQSEYL